MPADGYATSIGDLDVRYRINPYCSFVLMVAPNEPATP